MMIPSGLRPHFRAIAALGVGAMIVDTIMSAAFGYTIGYVPMIGLAIISLGSGLLLVAAEFFRRIGWHAVAGVSVAVWVISFLFNAWSNMGVATSTRMGEVQQATVQKTKYSERQKASEEAETRLALFTKQLSDLSGQHAWAATVSADGLRAQATNLKSSIASEAKRGGCGNICRGLQDKLVDVSNRIGVAEQRDDLTRRIEATKAVLAKARDDLAGTQSGISATANQSTLYAKLISWNLADDPDASAVTVANESTGIAMAVVIALVSAFLTFVGALPHLMEVGSSGESSRPLREPATSAPAAYAANPVSAQLETLQERVADAFKAKADSSRTVAQFGTLGDLIASHRAA